MSNVTIKLLNRDEIPASADIVLEAFNHVASDYGFPPDPDVSRLLSRLEDDYQQEVKMLGAFRDGLPVGFAEIDQKDEEVFEVRQLCVLPASQRQGIGQELLDFAEALIRSMGGVAIVCAVMEGKPWLKDWLGHNGFWEEVSGRPEGFHRQIFLLQKDLPSLSGSDCGSCSGSDGCGGSCGGCH